MKTRQLLRLESSVEDLKSGKFYRALVAEFFGVAILVYIGCGVCAEFKSTGAMNVALGFGLTVGGVCWTIGHVSGGHINPAVTLAMFLVRKVSLVRMLLYVIVQTMGATAGAAVLYRIEWLGVGYYKFNSTVLGSTLINYEWGVTNTDALIIEATLTFPLVLTIFGVSDPKRSDVKYVGPIAVAFNVICAILYGGELTGASMNPARSFGPIVMIDRWNDHWIYWVGPITGAAIAAILYETVLASNASFKRTSKMLFSSDYDPDADGDETPFNLTLRQARSLEEEIGHVNYMSSSSSITKV